MVLKTASSSQERQDGESSSSSSSTLDTLVYLSLAACVAVIAATGPAGKLLRGETRWGEKDDSSWTTNNEREIYRR